jgi:hypothetical protein
MPGVTLSCFPRAGCLRKDGSTGFKLIKQRRARRKQAVRIGTGLTAPQCAGDQAHIEPRRMCFMKKGYGLFVRSDAAGHPAKAKPGRIEQRPQIRLAILRLKRIGAREAPRLP